MVREYAPRGNALSLTSAPAFSTDGSFDVGVWNGHKYDTLEGYMATDRSATVTIYQTDVSGRWDWSKTIYGNNAGSSLVIVDVAASLKADLVRIVIQGTSGDTPTESGFRLVTKGKIAGQDDINISGQSIKTWMSGAITVLTSGPVPVNVSGQVMKVWESGAVTVLTSGPVPINPGAYAFNVSGAPTVLVSGPLIVKVSGETVVTRAGTPSMSGQAIIAVNVTSSSTLLLSSNVGRVAAIIVNDSDTTMYCAVGRTAVINQGLRLNAGGGTFILSKYGELYSQDDIFAVVNISGNKVATVQEMT